MDGFNPSYESVMAWEHAYVRYSHAVAAMDRQPRSDDVVSRYQVASRELAHAWRQLVVGGSGPWWVNAAVSTSAESLENQAREWDLRETDDPVTPTGASWFGDGPTAGGWFGDSPVSEPPPATRPSGPSGAAGRAPRGGGRHSLRNEEGER
ncbi:hypothetical protein GCM10009754_57030 [Amycolatopsis minnesotensis]|uniref:Uncharacterized protein n=1 Tax=Amycolatopsis minnesotensis TaxID=337894 RepID=A0ABN2RT66_9PSEU